MTLEEIVFFVHPGEPKAKSRARFVRTGRAYTPQETVTAQEILSHSFREALQGVRFDGPVAIIAVFFRPNFQRIDVDNLMKLVLDAGTKASAWIDDCYITAQAGFMELDLDTPRTIVALCSTQSTLDRSTRFTCTTCGIKFYRPGYAAFKHPPMSCSRACRYEKYRQDHAEISCPKCEIRFVRTEALQRYCSVECKQAARLVRRPRANQRPWPVCQVCGVRVSRREYLNCAGCRGKGRKRGAKNKPKNPENVVNSPI